MNPFDPISQILLGAAGDGTGGLLAGLLTAVGSKVARRFQPPPQQKALQAALTFALKAAFAAAPQNDPLTDYYLNCLSDFLRQEIVHEELAALLDPREPFDLARLRAAFMAISQGYPPEQIPDLDFDAFIFALTQAFYAAVKNQPDLQGAIQIERLDALVNQLDQLLHLTADMRQGVQALHLEARRAAELLAEIKELILTHTDNSGVNAVLQAYTAPPGDRPDPALLRARLADYVAWVAGRCGTLELRGIKREGQQVVQLDLDAVYVPLSAVTAEHDHRRAEGEVWRDVPMNAVLSLGNRLILTGGPGCGKTTILLHIAWTLTQALARDDAALAQARVGLAAHSPLPLPVYLPLGVYAAHLRRLAATPGVAAPQAARLDAFIPRHLIESHADFDLPADFFVQLLKAETPVILLLDGLDEVPDEAERVAVREAIEQLVTRYPRLRVVATCRAAAYHDRTALGKGFRQVRVKPLDDEQVASLIRQAYTHIHRHDAVQRTRKTDDLIQGVAQLEAERRQRLGREVPRLIDSPLMVRMLLIVHHSEHQLPDQRADLYLHVTNALLLPDYNPDEATASEIGGYIGGTLEAHLELVQHLAFHMQQRGEQQGRRVDERELRDILALKPAFAAYVERFIQLTRLRGTVLKEELGTYTFIHLTFQEFLAARYLAKVVWWADDMAAFLEGGPLLDSWWREPILLLAGYLHVEEPLTRAPDFLRRLAGLDAGAANRQTTPDTQLAAAELAGLGFLEWQRAQHDELRAALADRLADLLDQAVSPPAAPGRRAAAAAALGRLGDPRPGVTRVFILPNGRQLPDLHLCYVPAGPFWMGEGEKNEKEVGRVQEFLDYPYWIGRYPITNAQYDCFVQADGYANPDFWPEAKANGEWREDGRVDAPTWRDRPRDWGAPFNLPNHPVVGIMWYEALAFCRWLNAQLGLPAPWRFHLPSEAEWEKAARGGLQIPSDAVVRALSGLSDDLTPVSLMVNNPHPRRRYPWGDAPSADRLTPDHANYGQKSGATAAVGCYPRNLSPYGCRDLIGNVWEWTRSQDGPLPYDPNDGREELWRVRNTTWLHLRGGSWYSSEEWQRCGVRSRFYPVNGSDYMGVRLVLSPLPSLASGSSVL